MLQRFFLRFFEDALEILFKILWRVLGDSWEILLEIL